MGLSRGLELGEIARRFIAAEASSPWSHVATLIRSLRGVPFRFIRATWGIIGGGIGGVGDMRV
jgi:hypothetical protein